MRNQLTAYLDNAITGLILLLAGLTPLLFINQFTEFYEMPKLILLVVATILLLGLWIFSWIVKGKVVITRTPLDFPLIVLLVAIVVSAYFSSTRFSAIYGNFPRVHGSAVAWVTYILLYFVTVSHLKTITRIRALLFVLYGSAVVASIVSILSFFNIFLPFDFARGVNFTPTGSTFSTIALMLVLLPLPLLSVINKNKYLMSPVAIVLTTLFSVTVVLLGSLPTQIVLLVIFAVCIALSRQQQMRKTIGLLAIPVIAIIATAVLSYLPFPGNRLQQLQANFPREIQLPFAISWKISASAFRDAPFIGTGPSSYLFNFTSYKPAEFNLLNFWNFSFDSAHNEFLQVLGTLGVFGLIAFLLFCLVALNNGRRQLSLENLEARQENMHVTITALAVSAIVSVVLLAVHSTTLVSVVVSLFILAAFMMSQRSIREEAMEFSMGLKASTSNRQFDLFPILIFIGFLALAIPALFRTYNVVAADYYHRQALAQANRSGTLTYQYLQRAEALNPQVDLYRVDMAQTNFALANALAAKAATNQTGSGSASSSAALSDQDKQTIQTLLSQAINEGRASVALSPRSARNWEVLASIYRNITGVAQNALTFSLDAYGRAIQRDPLNPALRVNVGGIYYSVQNYDLAIRFFSDAANLKPDYVNAYYNLAIALREKGDFQNASVVAQQTVALLQKDPKNPDLKVATTLLNDLKAKIASGQTAPAAQTNSALNNQNISGVNVANLNNPPQVATPAAVRQNPNANLPQNIAPTAPVAPRP